MLRENIIGRWCVGFSEFERSGPIAISGDRCIGDMDGREPCRGQIAAGRLASRERTREALMAAFALSAPPKIRRTSLRSALKRAKQ
jgi:hypothetical protein